MARTRLPRHPLIAHPSSRSRKPASAQLVLDAYISADWQSITGNHARLGLSFLSIAFDVVFLVQHFVLYRQPSPEIDPSTGAGDREGAAAPEAARPSERDPLLASPNRA